MTMAIIVIFKLMTENRMRVSRSRKKGDKQHLKDEKDGKCPTGSGYFFDCACMKGSLANLYKPTKGVNNLGDTATSVVEMIKEWVSFVPAKHDFKLYIDTEEETAALTEMGLNDKVKFWGEDAKQDWMTDEGTANLDSNAVILFTSSSN